MELLNLKNILTDIENIKKDLEQIKKELQELKKDDEPIRKVVKYKIKSALNTEKSCKWCGRVFTVKHSTQRFCCDSCRYAYHNYIKQLDKDKEEYEMIC